MALVGERATASNAASVSMPRSAVGDGDAIAEVDEEDEEDDDDTGTAPNTSRIGSSDAQLTAAIGPPAGVSPDRRRMDAAPAPHESGTDLAAAGDPDDDEEDDVFVLGPIVRPDLPDTWVARESADGVYYINAARMQSSWELPPGT